MYLRHHISFSMASRACFRGLTPGTAEQSGGQWAWFDVTPGSRQVACCNVRACLSTTLYIRPSTVDVVGSPHPAFLDALVPSTTHILPSLLALIVPGCRTNPATQPPRPPRLAHQPCSHCPRQSPGACPRQLIYSHWLAWTLRWTSASMI